jgi:hypothetical protein
MVQLGENTFTTTETGSHGLEASLDCRLDQSGFFIDKTSRSWFNHLHFSNSLGFHFGKQPSIKVELDLASAPLENLLKSFTSFRYKELYTATYLGVFGFTSVLEISLHPPVNYNFQVNVNNDLQMTDAGRLDLNYLKQSFLHTVYKDGNSQRQIVAGISNPDFVPLASMPTHLKKAIVFSEDRNFYAHKGIDIQGIGLAIVTNLATRKISRGGSTITMQLMRNLFLNYERGIYKKVEEILLSWLTESVFKISKDRMLEIYLNIIEFAPGVYGISEASRFYFSKHPRALTLAESLMIVYIIPRPKFFLEALKSGSLILVENLRKHFENMAAEMLQMKVISKEAFHDLQLQYEVVFANGLGKIQLKGNPIHLHPVLHETYKKAFNIWVQRYEDLPRPAISHTYLSPEKQQELYQQGRTKPGNIVTNATAGQSPHNHQPSMAFDIAFKTSIGTLDWTEVLFERFARLVEEVDVNKEVVWGGSFHEFKDLPHFELAGWQKKARV